MLGGGRARPKQFGAALPDGEQLVGAHAHVPPAPFAREPLAQGDGDRAGHGLSSQFGEIAGEPAGFLILDVEVHRAPRSTAPSPSVHRRLPRAAGRIGWERGAVRVSGALDAPIPPRHIPRMNATAFDTLAAAREFEAAGVARDHAAAIVGIARRADAADRETLATKADIANMATKTDLAELEARLANRLIGAVLAIVAANAALLAVAIAILKFL